MKVLITLHIYCIFSLLELEVFINDGVESVDEGCSFVFGIFLSGVKIDLCFYFSGSAISLSAGNIIEAVALLHAIVTRLQNITM